jgi:hypothetical protein
MEPRYHVRCDDVCVIMHQIIVEDEHDEGFYDQEWQVEFVDPRAV